MLRQLQQEQRALESAAQLAARAAACLRRTVASHKQKRRETVQGEGRKDKQSEETDLAEWAEELSLVEVDGELAFPLCSSVIFRHQRCEHLLEALLCRSINETLLMNE